MQWQTLRELLQYVVWNIYFIALCNFEYYSMGWHPLNELAVMHLKYGCANGNGRGLELLSLLLSTGEEWERDPRRLQTLRSRSWTVAKRKRVSAREKTATELNVVKNVRREITPLAVPVPMSHRASPGPETCRFSNTSESVSMLCWTMCRLSLPFFVSALSQETGFGRDGTTNFHNHHTGRGQSSWCYPVQT
jgi:hypothetical protein